MNPIDVRPFYIRYLHIGIFLIIIINLVFLNYWMLHRKPQYTLSQIRTIASVAQTVPQQQTTFDEETLKQLCDEACVDAIHKELETATISAYTNFCDAVCVRTIYQKIAEASAAAKTGTIVVPTTQVPADREFFIPFGVGSSNTGDWADVPGMQTTVDTTNYTTIKKVTFEATIRIPTGNETAYIRLYNVTDKHPVWYSELSLDGGNPKLLTSQNITLDAGSKLYQVQMKTSLQFDAFVDMARVRITTN
jgi:hypothetical protein